MRCLIVSTIKEPLEVLSNLLDRRDVNSEFSSDLGAGIDLANESLDRFDFAIAVLPKRLAAGGAGSAAILVEMGVCAARQIPLFAIASPGDPPVAAIAPVMTVRAALDNTEALELHLDVFLNALARKRNSGSEWVVRHPDARPIENAEIFSSRSEAVSAARKLLSTQPSDSEHPAVREDALLTLIGRLLAEDGAFSQQKLAGTRGDQGIDLAFAHPSIQETVLVEVKQNAITPAALKRAQSQLASYVAKNSNAIGLLLVPDGIGGDRLQELEGDPLVRTLSFGEFFRIAETHHLGAFLRDTRNQIAHRS